MAELKKTHSNTDVSITGFLKENNLEKITNARGDNVIRGSIIIAVDELNSHKVQFYVKEITNKGEPSKCYKDLLNLLPDNTITIASFLKENSSADFKTAANASSKIWATARFEEYATRVDKQERSVITLKGINGGFKTAGDKSPFYPKANFSVKIYINDLIEEDNNSGRIIVEGLMPLYDKSVQKINFIAPVEDNIAAYIKNNYKAADTVTLKGDLVSIQERKRLNVDNSGEFFGRGNEPQYETKFIRERIIRGGSSTPIHQGEEGSITTAEVKAGLASREIKMDSNGNKLSSRSAQPMPSATSNAQKKVTTINFADDVDF